MEVGPGVPGPIDSSGAKAPEDMNEDEAWEEINRFLDEREPDVAMDAAAGGDPELYSPISEGAASEANDVDIGVLSSIAHELISFGNHVSEVFSRPRVTKLASSVGLRPGFALDSTRPDPTDNKAWDFNVPENVEGLSY